MIGFDGKDVFIDSHGINFYAPEYCWYDNEVYRTKDGKWLEDVATTFYVWTYLPEQNITMVRWQGENEVEEMLVEGNLSDDKNDGYGNVLDVFEKTRMTFFNFEEGSEFDLTFAQ